MRVAINMGSREFIWSTFFIAALIAGLITAITLITPAKAHDWYPMECCHEQDCAPVIKLEQVPTQTLAHAGMLFSPGAKLPSQMVVTTKHGTVIVPENFKRKPSKDGEWHACIRKGGSTGYLPVLVCLFEPPNT